MTLAHVGKQIVNLDDIIHAHADTDDYLTLTLRGISSQWVITGNEAKALWTVLKNRSIDVQEEYHRHLHNIEPLKDAEYMDEIKKHFVTDAERAAALEQARIQAMVGPLKDQVQAWKEALDRFLRDNGHNSNRFPYLSLGPDAIYTFHMGRPEDEKRCVVLKIPITGTDSERAQDLRDQLAQAIQGRVR